jgi:hypothetical protein
VSPIFNNSLSGQFIIITSATTPSHANTSIVTSSVNPTVLTEMNASICEGGSYEFKGETLTDAGEYS